MLLAAETRPRRADGLVLQLWTFQLPPPKELNVLDTLSQITHVTHGEAYVEEYTAEQMRSLAKKLGELQTRADTLANRIEEDELAKGERGRNAVF